MQFLSDINVKWLWNIPEEKYFTPLSILYPFIKSLVSSFVDIVSTFFDSSFSLFSTSTCLVSFDLTFLFQFFYLSSKSIFFTKLVISFLLAQLSCANLAAKPSAINLLNHVLVIYWLWSGISFSAAVRTIVVAKLVVWSISFLTFFILALRASVVAKLVILVISFLI